MFFCAPGRARRVLSSSTSWTPWYVCVCVCVCVYFVHAVYVAPTTVSALHRNYAASSRLIHRSFHLWFTRCLSFHAHARHHHPPHGIQAPARGRGSDSGGVMDRVVAQ